MNYVVSIREKNGFKRISFQAETLATALIIMHALGATSLLVVS